MRSLPIILIFLVSVIYGQDAVSYFDTHEGTVWKYEQFSLDESNNKILNSIHLRTDSLSSFGFYRGRNSFLCLTNLKLGQKSSLSNNIDSLFYSFDGPIASDYCFFFTPPYN